MNNFTIKIENCRIELRQLQNENEKLTSRLRAEQKQSSELQSQVARAHEERRDMAESCGAKEEEIASMKRIFQASEEKIELLEVRHEQLVKENMAMKDAKESWELCFYWIMKDGLCGVTGRFIKLSGHAGPDLALHPVLLRWKPGKDIMFIIHHLVSCPGHGPFPSALKPHKMWTIIKFNRNPRNTSVLVSRGGQSWEKRKCALTYIYHQYWMNSDRRRKK